MAMSTRTGANARSTYGNYDNIVSNDMFQRNDTKIFTNTLKLTMGDILKLQLFYTTGSIPQKYLNKLTTGPLGIALSGLTIKLIDEI